MTPKRPVLRPLLSAGLLALLAACASDADFRRADEASCAGYGFTPGTDAFASCLQRENLGRRYSLPPTGLYGWYGAAGWGW
jgi:hypothetical protein